jgi:radical SAM-linked protein
MRCFERMLRRAGLPFHATEGFNPKPRLIFALSLSLGIVGADEVVELELDEELPVEDIHAQLSRQAPDGLTIRSVRRIAPNAGAQVRRVCYRIALTPSYHEHLAARIEALLSAEHCWVDRTRPQPRRVDARPYVRGIQVYADALELDVWVTPNGTARPDELLAVLGLDDELRRGAVLERTLMELHDECVADANASRGSTFSTCRAPKRQVDTLPPGEVFAAPPSHSQPEGNT